MKWHGFSGATEERGAFSALSIPSLRWRAAGNGVFEAVESVEQADQRRAQPPSIDRIKIEGAGGETADPMLQSGKVNAAACLRQGLGKA